MAHFHNNALIGAAGAGGAEAYQINRSLRFNDGDSPSLSRTVSTAGNRRTYTFSFWVKRSELGRDDLYKQGSDPYTMFLFRSDDVFGFDSHNGSLDFDVRTTRKFRDLGAWMHIVLAVDTTQATNTNRVKLYVNGVQETLTPQSSGWPDQNYDTFINFTNPSNAVLGNNCNGYLAEFHHVDGQQLAASDFGEYDDNNVWQPKEYAGAYDQKSGGRSIANSSGALPILNTSGDDGEAATSGVRTDSNASSIVLALPLNGSNGGTTITDYHHTVKGSGSAKAISIYTGSASGGAVTSTAVSKYYGSSFYAVRGATNNYSASDYIHRTGDSDLDLGTGSFCVEFWYYPTAYTANSVIFDNRHQSNSWPNSSNGFSIVVTGNGSIFTYSGGNQIINHSTKLTLNAWNHIAYTRDGSTERLFVNGDFFSTTASSSRNYNEGRFHLGSAANNGEGSDGYYQDLRIYKGVAKYTSNFTVPVAGAGGVNSFFLKFADNSSNAALGTDSSGLNNTWTVNNLSAAYNFGLTNAAQIVGTSKYFQFPITYATTVTYEYFIRITTDGTYNYGAKEQGTNKWNIGHTGNSVLFGNFNTGFTTFSNTGLNDGSWHFVRLTTTGSSTSLYVDGSLIATNSSGGNVSTGSQVTNRIEGTGSGAFEIAHLRITTGGTPPTTGVPNISDMNTAAGSGGTLVFYDKLDDIASSGTKTSDGGNVTITMSAATVGVTDSNADSLIDTPTNYEASSGNNGGNYCTWNPLTMSRGNMSDGNLLFYGDGTNTPRVNGTISQSSGKWYYEATVLNDGPGTGSGDVHNSIGWGLDTVTQIESAPNTGAMTHSFYFMDSGWYKNFSGSNTNTGNGKWLTGDVIGVAADLDNNTITFYRNGTSVLSQTIGVTAGTRLCPAHQSNTGNYGRSASNFGQRPFKYPPGGTGGPAATFKALCTTNLSDPPIADGSVYFDIGLYTGNASTQSVSLNLGPDLLWLKSRSAVKLHALCDSVRGDGKLLYANSTLAEQDIGASVVDLTSSGFNLGYNSGYTLVSHNHNGESLVAWAWDAGTSTASNTAGSITSNVRASQTAGFSIATYTGNGTNNSTIGHGLNAAPSFVIIKNRDSAYGWAILHTSAGLTGTTLDGSAEYNMLYFSENSSADNWTNDQIWNPTSTTVKVNGAGVGNWVNKNGDDYVMYSWAPVAGYSAFGSYEGNGSNDGPFVNTGFRPRFILLKNIDNYGTGYDWFIHDTERDTYNVSDSYIKVGTSDSEQTYNMLDILSNGFKIRNNLASYNLNSHTHVWAAFAEHPFKTARAR